MKDVRLKIFQFVLNQFKLLKKIIIFNKNNILNNQIKIKFKNKNKLTNN